ncbi:MAG: DUF72 domain-containing protein [Candidatus Lokiarchaeota archaeon]|nr:DUF72 domain-containing protein [Candidatus Lokiarchaeota archaeon]
MTDINLGCSGWSYEDWKGYFYDKNINSNLMLLFYSKVFNTVEINSTFYALPRSEKIAENWYKKTPKNFIFSVKFPQQITHKTLGKKRLSSELHYMTRFYKLIDPLKEKLGPILIQFPPKFGKDLDLLEELISYLLDRYKYTMEFRNDSWIINKKLDSDTLKLLEKHDIAYCIVSEPGPIPSINVISTDFVYIRWHGLNNDHWYNYLYSDEEIKEEKKRVEKIKANDDVKKIYGYFNNHLNGQAPANCRYLLQLLGKKTLDPKSININRLNLPKGQKSIDSFFG